jgi:Ca2+-transporting ATPase
MDGSPVSTRGLSSDEAAARLETHGPNLLKRESGDPLWRILGRQFTGPMVVLLAAATVLSAALGAVADAVAIATILTLNGLVGFVQEYHAQRAVLALRAMTAPRARVVRDGHPIEIPAATVVPGDLLLLEAGDVVAADGCLLEANNLSTIEAALTGESVPVDKHAGGVIEVPERDEVYAGTAVATGIGLALVRSTGMDTELGKIAHLLQTARHDATPLQQRLAKVNRTLLWICIGIVAVVAALGALHGEPWMDVLLGSVSLAVAAVPEGLPAVVTVALAIGVRRMAKRNVLVRKLSAVETLGSATVVCTDKTGTLTTGKMTVREIWSADTARLLYIAAACNDADLTGPTGDPTEIALLHAARATGVERPDIEHHNPRAAVNPFDSDRKRMSIQRADGKLYVKGAVDLLLPLCVAGAEGAASANARMAALGLRVLAMAEGASGDEAGLTLVGLAGLADPPRLDAIEAVAVARKAGLITVMITGDHPVTAHAIARELGILRDGVDPAERVHARATPEQKLQIVRAWKQRGAVVAMTGDGVNDAPALREAHIGIAMGRSGTEVTREAADMVLADDNFSSIIDAIHEGRAIFDNIRKTLVYLLAGNAGELMVMLGASIAGLPLPLLPLQLLWVNLVTDGLPALALVMDPAVPDLLLEQPRPPQQPMLGRAEWLRIAAGGVLQAVTCLSVFVVVLQSEGVLRARTLAFATLVFGELFRAFTARSAQRGIWEVGLFTNRTLVAVVLCSTALQIAIHQTPAIRHRFGVGPLSLQDAATAMAVGAIPMALVETAKWLRRRR